MEDKKLYGRTTDGDIVELIDASHDITDLIRDGDTIKIEYEDKDLHGFDMLAVSDEFIYDSSTDMHLLPSVCYIHPYQGDKIWTLNDEREWW